MSKNGAQIRWHVDTPPDPADVQELRKNLQGFNIANSTAEEGQALGIFLRDKAGEMLGGASGWLWGDCLEIDYLWIAKALRGRGIGRQLMLELEGVALSRGARLAIVDTFSFQAPVYLPASRL